VTIFKEKKLEDDSLFFVSGGDNRAIEFAGSRAEE